MMNKRMLQIFDEVKRDDKRNDEGEKDDTKRSRVGDAERSKRRR